MHSSRKNNAAEFKFGIEFHATCPLRSPKHLTACSSRIVGGGTDVFLQSSPDGYAAGSPSRHQRCFARGDEHESGRPAPGFLVIDRSFPQPDSVRDESREVARHPSRSQEDVVDVDHHHPPLGHELVRTEQRQKDRVFVDPDAVSEVPFVEHREREDRHGLESLAASSPRRENQLPRAVGPLPQILLRFLVGVHVPGVSIDDGDRIVQVVARNAGFRRRIDRGDRGLVFFAGDRNDPFRCRRGGEPAADFTAAEPQQQQHENPQLLHSTWFSSILISR
mmetsp:Transcript_3762/g.9861  ORF Transcript_3762/g.9861 Transcript_3762/m.9861 type:complete len:278 (+) Transcript_3762:114-947(+)